LDRVEFLAAGIAERSLVGGPALEQRLVIAEAAADVGAKDRSMPHFTSADVIGEPSLNLSPSLSVNFQVLPPSVVVPVSVPRSGVTLASLPGAVFQALSRRCTRPSVVIGRPWL